MTVAPTAPDERLDALAGTRGGRFASSGRFEGRPGRRASRAFDGDAATAWIAPWDGDGAWLEWTSRRRDHPAVAAVPTPEHGDAPSRAGGGPRRRTGNAAARGRRRWARRPAAAAARAHVPARDRGCPVPSRHPGPAAPPAGRGDRGGRGSRACGPPTAPARRIEAACGALRVRAAGRMLPLQPVGTVADFDAGRPLRAAGCGPPLALPARQTDVTTESRAVPPLPAAAAIGGPGWASGADRRRPGGRMPAGSGARGWRAYGSTSTGPAGWCSRRATTAAGAHGATAGPWAHRGRPLRSATAGASRPAVPACASRTPPTASSAPRWWCPAASRCSRCWSCSRAARRPCAARPPPSSTRAPTIRRGCRGEPRWPSAWRPASPPARCWPFARAPSSRRRSSSSPATASARGP